MEDGFLVGTSGDGLIFSDPSEGVLEPGAKAVTFTRTRVSDGQGGWTYVDPFQVIITDFSALKSRGEVTNCLMSNNPDVYCDSESGSGKRIKTQLTGRDPFNITMRSTASTEYPSVDYFTFGKTSNFTGARITGFSVELLDKAGNPMGDLNPADAVLYNLNTTDIGLGAKLPEGLFGEGGHEGNIGFFSDEKAGFAGSFSDDTLVFGGLSNSDFVANFGTAFLDNSMTPEGIFWDDNADPGDESALVAWNNLTAGGWTYGTLETAQDIDARLAELAADLGVEVSELAYAPGALVPEDIVAAAQANGLFEEGEIEDIRNANLNFTMTVASLNGDEFTLRITPSFAGIVETAETDTQFQLAGQLDAAANVPYMDLGYASEYQAAIASLMSMDAASRADALESIGFSFLPAFASLGFEFSRNQVAVITGALPGDFGTDGTVSTQGNVNSGQMGEDFYWLFGLEGATNAYDASANSIGYDIDYASLSIGAEKFVNLSTSFGVLFGGTTGKAVADNNRGDIDTTGVSLAAFARGRFADRGFVQGIVGYQDLSYDSTRNVMGQVATGKTDGSQVFAAVKGEYMYNTNGLNIGPTASLEYYDMSVNGFTETGAGAWNLTVGDQSSHVWLGSLGVRGDYMVPNSSGNTLLTAGLAYTMAEGGDSTVQGGFAGLPGGSFPVSGLDDNWVDLQLGFQTRLAENATSRSTLSGGYLGSYGNSYQSHRLHIAANIAF